MADLRMGKGIVRKSFGKIKDIVPVPDLIGIQCKSFNDFAQLDYIPSKRQNMGLEKVLRDIFPIDYEDKMSLEYVSYELGHWACTCGKLTGIVNRYTWNCSSCKASDTSRLSDDWNCSSCSKATARYMTCSHCLSRVAMQLPLTVQECRVSEQTFSLPLKIKIQLVSWNVNDKGQKTVRDIKEQDIFFADIPVMIDAYEEEGQYKLGSKGTFVINGVDRVVVSQLHRSPGVVFAQSKKVKDVRGRPYFVARIIPMRGSWLDFEFDSNDLLYVRVDKKKKILVTTFLQALGFTRDEIIPIFYSFDTVHFEKDYFYKRVDEQLIGQRVERGMIQEKAGQEFLGSRITKDILKQLQKVGIEQLQVKEAGLIGRILAQDLVHSQTGEILAERGQILTVEIVEIIKKLKKVSFDLIVSSGYVFQPTIAVTLAHDSCSSYEDALKELHAKIWPGDSSSLKEVKDRFENLFFNSRFYDLTKVGRIRMNRKLGLSIDENTLVLTKEDIVASIKYLVNLRERGEGELDDIDHLGNRRVRLVGELLNNQVYLGFMRIERIVRERFRTQELSPALMPQDFLNVKPLGAVLREFFGTGQLSQFMDQTNPLSEIAHKRRLSALGPGGVLKDRATFEIRDVHTSHYGRICPIETPEGQTVGLISSLATYATVNELGFIETAYRTVQNEKVRDDVVFLDAFQEYDKHIAQADSVNPKNGKIKESGVVARYEDDFSYVAAEKIDLVDLSPKQLVSVSTALIPFLEHDDATRALMGSNMQRQAVPLVRAQAPIIGTGMEEEICKSSGVAIVAKRPGIVEYVSSKKVVIRVDRDAFKNIDEWLAQGIDVYYLEKFQRSSHSTWVHQSPIVKRGDRVRVGDMLSNGSAIDGGELALGTNVIVAFMPWQGYNFEDAIVLSKRLVADDSLTSVHLEEYVVDARDTKLGPEEITRDIPNVSEKALESLDEEGIVKIGTRVKPGDVLVGKVTLKGDIQYSPEEKLLRAIFGEKSREVRDTSLRVPPGVEGTITDVRVFSRSGIRKDKRYKEMVMKSIENLEQEFADYNRSLLKMVTDSIACELADTEPAVKVSSLMKDKFYSYELLSKLTYDKIEILKTKDKKATDAISTIKKALENQLLILEELKKERIAKLKKGDPLPSGVIKMVKVYIASKRSVSVGDKVAGRHGNKGVVSTIVPREDMPFLDNGTSVDIILNPLGVPSRMNVGQILETILGLAGKELGKKLTPYLDKGYAEIKEKLQECYSKDLIDAYEAEHGEDAVLELAKKSEKIGIFYKTPVFDGAHFEHDIQPLLRSLNLPESGTFKLRDGRSGDYFDQPVTVGSMYLMKLDHMVDDKLHARSVGPYSLVTQQPLGGKSQMGGQRFGEMEVWALEAYGAAYALQEMLTYKSDDINGRHKVYSAIVRSEDIPEPGLPESFNVLVKELQSLGLQVDLIKTGKEESSE
jgi:DNA-directed RNA polymerase subunit beta